MNVTYHDCEGFVGRNISIGVQHRANPDQLFYFYGQLTDVTPDAVKLQMTHGVKIIPMAKILEIKIKERG